MPALNPAEQSKVKRDRRVAQGKCPGCGRKHQGRYINCPLCRKKGSLRTKRYHDERIQMKKDLAEISKILSMFPGETPLEKAQAAAGYYGMVEAALV